MIHDILLHVQQIIYCRANSILSMSPLYSHLIQTLTHTVTVEDYIYPVKFIGPFTKRRKAVTNFRRA